MIKTRNELELFLKEDKKALGISRKRPYVFGDEIWKYQIALRRAEYYENTKKTVLGKFVAKIFKIRLKGLALKCGFSIPLNVFDYGLSIAHYGTICVNAGARIGKNCRIHEGVTIGASGGGAPTIGDNVFISSGAKVIGEITVGNNIAIGANAVVTKTFLEDGITIAGVPAKKISENDSHKFLKQYLE